MPGKMYSLWSLYVRTELPEDATSEETELAHHAFNMGIYAYVKVLNDRIEHGDTEGALEEIRTLARTIALAQEQNRSRSH